VRVNTARTCAENIMQTLRDLSIPYQQVSWKPDALMIAPAYRDAVLASEPYQQGLLYSQNLSSQLAPLLLAPRPGEEVLDMCAAPGGKTAQLACLMQETGRIAAVEKIKARFYKLKNVLRAQQHHCVHTYLADSTALWRKTPERFDRILLDAPCSSESRFYLPDPETYRYWKPRKIKEAARKQKKLLYSAVHCLKPGGTLVYSTCSFAPEENEGVIDQILKQFPQHLEIVPIQAPVSNTQPGLTQWQNKKFNDSLMGSVRILPDETMDGFFICKLTKTATTLPANH
jgi:16S rRNA (cytosine1407-C5)-methyltransferase